MITQQRSNQFTALSGQIMQPEDLKKVKWDHCHPWTCLSFQTFPCKMQAGQPTTCLALQKPVVKDKCSALASVQEAARGNSMDRANRAKAVLGNMERWLWIIWWIVARTRRSWGRLRRFKSLNIISSLHPGPRWGGGLSPLCSGMLAKRYNRLGEYQSLAIVF